MGEAPSEGTVSYGKAEEGRNLTNVAEKARGGLTGADDGDAVDGGVEGAEGDGLVEVGAGVGEGRVDAEGDGDDVGAVVDGGLEAGDDVGGCRSSDELGVVARRHSRRCGGVLRAPGDTASAVKCSVASLRGCGHGYAMAGGEMLSGSKRAATTRHK